MADTLLQQLSDLDKQLQSKNDDADHQASINHLVLSISKDMPENPTPTEEYVPALIKGCSIYHHGINQFCLRALGLFLAANGQRSVLFLTTQMFMNMKRYISSDVIKTKMFAIAFLSHLIESSISSLTPAAHEQKFISLMFQLEFIPICIQEMTSTDPDIQTMATKFISILCETPAAVECELQQMSFFRAKIVSQIQSILLNRHISQEILQSIQRIVFAVSKMIKSANDKCISNMLRTLGVMIYFDETPSSPMAMILSLVLTQMIKKVDIGEPFQYFGWDTVSEHTENKQALRAYFRKKANFDKLLFDRTMQKYLKRQCDFEVPIVIKQEIERYYTLYTVKKVDEMEFNLLKRLVQFTDDKYCDRTIFGSVCCLDIINENAISVSEMLPANNATRGFMQCFVAHGLLQKMQTLLVSKVEHIVSVSLDLLLHALADHFKEVLRCNILDSLKKLVSQLRAAKMENCGQGMATATATKALIVLAKMVLLANSEQCTYLYANGIVAVIFETLSALFGAISLLNEHGWEGICRATQRILNDGGTETRDLILKYLRSCDESKLDDQQKQHLSSLMELCSVEFKNPSKMCRLVGKPAR